MITFRLVIIINSNSLFYYSFLKQPANRMPPSSQISRNLLAAVLVILLEGCSISTSASASSLLVFAPFQKPIPVKVCSWKEEELFGNVHNEKGTTGKFPSVLALLPWSFGANKDYVMEDHAYDETHKKVPRCLASALEAKRSILSGMPP